MILNEKFTLNEKFILQEDSIKIEQLKQMLAGIKNEFENTSSSDTLSNKFNNVEQELKTFDSIIDETKSKIKPISAQIKFNSDDSVDLKSLVNIDSTALIKVVEECFKSTKKLKILSKLNGVNKILQDTNITIESLNLLINEIQDKLREQLNEIKSKRENTIKIVEKYLKVLDDLRKDSYDDSLNINGQIINSSVIISNLKKNFDALLNTPDKILAAINNINSVLVTLNSKINNLQKQEKVTNWDKLFAQAVQYDANTGSRTVHTIWNRYFNEEWKGYDKNILIRINDDLFNELNVYGFYENKNPFIKFLKYMLKNSKTFPESISKNPIIYGEIHNGVIDKFISENDLIGAGSVKLENIIFCDDLYSKDANEINRYLKLQAVARKLYDSEDLSQNAEAEKVRSYSNGIIDFISDLFYKDGSIVDQGSTGNKSNGLKDIKSIYSELNFVFGDKVVKATEISVQSQERNEKIKLDSSTVYDFIKSMQDLFKTESFSDEKADAQKIIAVLKNNNSSKDANLSSTIKKFFKKYNYRDIDESTKKIIIDECNKVINASK